MDNQKPIIRRGTIVEWSGSKLKVLNFNHRDAHCRIVETGTVIWVPLHQLQERMVVEL